jgi:hypothetical protein
MQGRGVALSDLWRLSDMIRIRKLSLCVMGFMMAATLAACQDSEPRPKRHFQNALALPGRGRHRPRAVEFRNVFQNNGLHRGGAGIRRDAAPRGRSPKESYSQYLRLVEQQPDHLEARTRWRRWRWSRVLG